MLEPSRSLELLKLARISFHSIVDKDYSRRVLVSRRGIDDNTRISTCLTWQSW